ncbi:unnamed protein product [Caenorhabditis auriculariae]|uniref:VWFA domain-containing protein n=1 Tax=Caenorhabditis auriculariae TaxID=2777116 RepID=A0A8S1H1V8_9PELO|nr:unnamed protein product [Caenorhabditis auriculariae]
MPPKKAATPKGPSKRELAKGKHDALLILLDCGRNMAEAFPETESGKSRTAFEMAKETLDWVISRKIFSESPDRIGIVLFGRDSADSEGNVYVHNEILEKATFDNLKFLQNEVTVSTEARGDVGHGITSALNVLREHIICHEQFVDARNLLIVTNGHSDKEQLEIYVSEFGSSINDLGINLAIVGISGSNKDGEEDCLLELVKDTGGSTFSFENLTKALSHFVPKQADTRLNNKQWEIAPGIRLPLAMSVKSFQAKTKLKSQLVSSSGQKVARMVETTVLGDNEPETEDLAMSVPLDSQSGRNTQTFASPKRRGGDEFIDDDDDFFEKKPKIDAFAKDELCTGYFFGQSLLFFDEEEEAAYNHHNLNEGEKGGCMKLIQFTKRQNILPGYFIGKQSYTVMPGVNKQTSNSPNLSRSTLALIKAMLENEAVAICRYAYDASKHLQLLALIPHVDEESGIPFLRALRLPFADDMRNLKFPRLDANLNLEEEEETGKKDKNSQFLDYDTKPTASQLTSVDGLIDLMALSGESGTDFASGTVLDPHLQLQCLYVKNHVLNGDQDDFSNDQSVAASAVLKKSLAPKMDVVEKSGKFFNKFATEFNLQKVEKVTRQKVEMAPIDIKAKIEEARNILKTTAVSDSSSGKLKKPKETPEEKLEREFGENPEEAAMNACEEHVRAITALCMIPANTIYASRIFEMPADGLMVLRQFCVRYNVWRPFNGALRTIRSSPKCTNFVDYMGDGKQFSLITNEECSSSDVTADEAVEFWEENEDDVREDSEIPESLLDY